MDSRGIAARASGGSRTRARAPAGLVAYTADMSLAYRSLSLCALLLAAGCGDSQGQPTTDTPNPTTTETPPDPTTTTTEPTTTTGTTATTAPEETSSGSTTTGGPALACGDLKDQFSCISDETCEWAQVLAYTHGTQGCQGSIRDFCINKEQAGGLTVKWRENEGDIEVVRFEFDPSDLGDDWKTCDCDGPLACLCAGAELDCPERLEDFCTTITSENGCKNAAAADKLTCSWFSVSPEGPVDDKCTGDAQGNLCLPATGVSENTCDPIALPYPQCASWTDPVYYREVDGVVQVTTRCGPEPIGWTKCVPDDPAQPGECACRCL